MEPTPEEAVAYAAPRATATAADTAHPGGLGFGSTRPGERYTGPVVPLGERTWMDAGLSPDERGALLLAAMTLDEKIALMTGDADVPDVVGFSNAGIERLGIPALRMADAGSGLRRPLGTPAATAMPSPLALAATWDTSAGAEYGRVVADEAFALRNNVVLGPNADLARVPWWGRIAESVGEDPHLAADMTAGVPAGVQRPGVLATYKHPMIYHQETNRAAGQNSIVDERTVREVYAPPFESAIRGGVASMMSSFNKINGVYACENAAMQNELLRDAFGFRGFIMSDYLANHSTSPANGLDMETPGLPVQPTFYGPLLRQAVDNGSVTLATIDQACARILWAMFVTGLFDVPLPDTYQEIPYQTHGDLAQEIEERAITLLKNDPLANNRSVLPITPHVGSIAVIGADIDRPARLGGSSFVTVTAESVGILQGIIDHAPASVVVRSAAGTDRITSGDGIFTGFQPLSSSVQSPPEQPGTPGVRTEFYANADLWGEPFAVTTEPEVTFNIFAFNIFEDVARATPPLQTRSLRATSVLTVPTSGSYAFSLAGWGDARLWVDDVEVAHLDSYGRQRHVDTEPMSMQEGSQHTIRVEYRATGDRAGGLEIGAVQLGWSHPDDAYSPAVKAAAELAGQSDVAVVFARTIECEQQDSGSLSLPRDQDTLIRAVAAANPNTVVVLATGVPVTTPWAAQVPAVVQSYFGGGRQGAAIARVLFGDVSPSGRLPYTMALDEEQYAVIGIRNPVATEDDVDVHYREERHLGYRGFLKHDLTPQFAFGTGLSYTTFEYGEATVTPSRTDGAERVIVRFTLTNTGTVRGTEVAQAYLETPSGAAEPITKLVGFARVALDPGQTRQVEIPIDPDHVTHPLAAWMPEADTWATVQGTYRVHVGRSSADLPTNVTFEVR
jgi:beta-glucosidase